jgi:hypothetical protein
MVTVTVTFSANEELLAIARAIAEAVVLNFQVFIDLVFRSSKEKDKPGNCPMCIETAEAVSTSWLLGSVSVIAIP